LGGDGLLKSMQCEDPNLSENEREKNVGVAMKEKEASILVWGNFGNPERKIASLGAYE